MSEKYSCGRCGFELEVKRTGDELEDGSDIVIGCCPVCRKEAMSETTKRPVQLAEVTEEYKDEEIKIRVVAYKGEDEAIVELDSPDYDRYGAGHCSEEVNISRDKIKREKERLLEKMKRKMRKTERRYEQARLGLGCKQ